MLLGFGLTSLAFLLFFLVGNPSQLMIVSLIVSIGLSASSLLLLALIPDVASDRAYGAVVGIYGSFEDLGPNSGPGHFWANLEWLRPGLDFCGGFDYAGSRSILLAAPRSESPSPRVDPFAWEQAFEAHGVFRLHHRGV